MTAPMLTADIVNNYPDEQIEIEFPLNNEWVNQIVSILVSTDNGNSYVPINWQPSWFTTDRLILPMNVLGVGQNLLKIQATNYHEAYVTQTIILPLAEGRIQSSDETQVSIKPVQELLIIENSALNVGQIKQYINSVNGTNQTYSFYYNDGDNLRVYNDNERIKPYHSSVLYVTAEDGVTKLPYTILVTSI